MPEPGVLRRMVDAGQCVVVFGRAVLYRFDAADIGMRNLAIVALTDAGRRIDEVAEVFELTATYVSMLRGRAARAGSAGLVRRRGRPPKLTARQQVQWASPRIVEASSMMDGCADRGQGLASGGVFGEFFDGDHLLAAWADAASAQALAGS